MPTQRTKEIVISDYESDMIKLAARGMSIANLNYCHSNQSSTYGGFYRALQCIMQKLCHYDPDFMELWDSHRIQGSLDLSSPEDYPEQIKFVLEREGIDVRIYT